MDRDVDSIIAQQLTRYAPELIACILPSTNLLHRPRALLHDIRNTVNLANLNPPYQLCAIQVICYAHKPWYSYLHHLVQPINYTHRQPITQTPSRVKIADPARSSNDDLRLAV